MSYEWPAGFAAPGREADAALILSTLHSLHAARLVALSRRHGTASACLRAVFRREVGSVADQELARDASPRTLRRALDDCGARAVLPGMAEFPQSLFALEDPPIAIFVKGRSLVDMVPGVAVVGARSCSSTGRDIATSIGRGLGRAGITVVSGAARGIDAASQRGAVQVGGNTVAVLGSGIDVAYPHSSADLIERLAVEGAVLSEYHPDVPAAPYRFPARNRLIAALSRGVVIVEGAAKSGTLITAEFALQMGRGVYAVPGPTTSPMSEAPLSLIRDGARAIRNVDDLLADLGEQEGSALLPDAVLTDEERVELRTLSGPTLPEHLIDELGWPIARVMAVLMQLELRGFVTNRTGRFEQRVVGS